MTEAVRFPKLLSPFVREDRGGEVVTTPNVREEYEWVFDRADEVVAVEKLDGTNCAVRLVDGEVSRVFTRLGDDDMQPTEPFGQRDHHFVTRGVQNSLHRGYLGGLDDGIHYGELVGPVFGGKHVGHANPHELTEFLFIPFSWARKKLAYESYGRYGVSYEDISEWFETGLFSLFATMFHNDSIEEARENRFVEGVVFYHPDFAIDGLQTTDIEWRGEETTVATNVVKLRRDMFPWFNGVETFHG